MSESDMVSDTETERPSPRLLIITKNKLIHPTGEKIQELKKFPDTTFGRNFSVRLYTAKEDWLLFTQNSCSEHDSRYLLLFKAFFFNPFTQATFWLPDLLGPPMSMSFTSSPTSADWKVVVVRRSYSETSRKFSIVIDTINCGENKWTSCGFEFRDNSSFEFSYCNPILYKGMCFLFDKHSTLLIHDLKKKIFFLKEGPGYLGRLGGEQYMLESDGKLLAVFADTDGSWVLVCQWNLTKMIWEKLRSLGNKALFLSRPYSTSETVIARGMGNRIYFPRLVGDHCLFYSLDTKRFHTFDGSSFTSFHGSKTDLSSTWISPCQD